MKSKEDVVLLLLLNIVLYLRIISDNNMLYDYNSQIPWLYRDDQTAGHIL